VIGGRTTMGVLLVTLALALAAAARAQKVYRCGPDGRVYQQTACAEGKAFDASDPRTAEQRRAAETVAKTEAKTAAKLDDTAPPPPKSGKSPNKAEPAKAPPEKAASSVSAAKAESKTPVYLIPKPASGAKY